MYPDFPYSTQVIINNRLAVATFAELIEDQKQYWYIQFTTIPSYTEPGKDSAIRPRWEEGDSSIQPFSFTYKSHNNETLTDGIWGKRFFKKPVVVVTPVKTPIVPF